MAWKPRLGNLAARFLGAVLLVAALAKAAEPAAFAEQIQLEGLDFLFSSRVVVLIALALETGLGVALLIGIHRLWILLPSGVLVVFFLFLTGRNYWLVLQGVRDETASCGCFGTLLERTPAEAFWQDFLLLVPALLLALWARRATAHSFPTFRFLVSAAMAGGIALYAAVNPDLQMANMAAEVASKSAQQEELFVPVQEYHLIVEQKPRPKAKIYHSEQSVSFLILDPELPAAVLLRARTGTVETMKSDHIRSRADGTLVLVSKADPKPAGTFQVGAGGIFFTIENREVELKSSEG